LFVEPDLGPYSKPSADKETSGIEAKLLPFSTTLIFSAHFPGINGMLSAVIGETSGEVFGGINGY
jgi:hypothetical protein